MNTDPSSVPIITLAGISSLTNLLSELPFPNPLPQTRKSSLLHSTRLTSEAQKALNVPSNSANPNLVQELLQVLRITSSDHVDPGEGDGADPVAGPGAPELLKTIILNDGSIFKPRPTFNSSNNNPGYALVGHNELYQSNQRMLEEGAYNSMQSSVNGPCLSYEHQPHPMQGHPYQNQDFEYLMNGINPALMQQMSSNQGAGALLMGGAMLQASNQLRTGELSHFPGGLITAQYPNQNASHPLMANFMGPIQSATGDGSFKIAGTPPSGMTGVVKNSNKSFVESSPAQASSAPPAGAEPVIRMGNTGSSAFDQSIMSTPLPTSPYATTGYATFQQLVPQSSPFSGSPMATPNQHQPRQTQHQQQHMAQARQIQQQHHHHHHHQQHNLQQQHLYQQQDLLTRDLSNVKVVLEPLDLDAHRAQLKKPSSESSTGNKMPGDMSPRVSLMRLDEKKEKSLSSNIMQYNVVQDSSQDLKIKLSKKGVKRRHSDDDDESQESSDFSSSLTERVKRRKRSNSTYGDSKQIVDDDDEETSRRGFHYDNSDLSSGPSSVSEVSRRKEEKKKKKHHHHHHHHHRHGSSAPNDGLDDDHLEGATVRKFYSLIDQVIEAAEEIDLSTFKDDDEETSCLTETIISKQLLLEVVSEAAKLKTVANMNQVPYEKLIKLLTLLQFSIKQGLRNVPLNEVDDEVGDDLFRELTLEHVTCGLDACLAAMLVMTSKDMPKQVFIEDVIDKVVRFTRNHLRNFIFPVFDPVYRVDPSGKGGQSSMKMKRSKASMTSMKDRTILSIYNKLTDVTSLLAELVDIQDLTDTIVLQMSSLSVSPFFVENIPELQLNALKLVTNIFSKYEKHRQLILEDILSSLARLPSSKKNLRSYRLNVNENIQMVTALALQLIQCVVKLPSNQDDELEPDDETLTSANDVGGGDDVTRRKKKSGVDKEVVILSSYDTAMSTAHNFLHVFLGKCSAKEEDNYRSLFGNFVNDLLSTVNKPEWPAAELLLSLLGHLLVRQFSCKSVEMSLRVASLDYLGIVAARLRKDAVSSHLNEGTLDDIVSRVADKEEELRQLSSMNVLGEDSDEEAANPLGKNKDSPQKLTEISKTESLQKALLEYLTSNTEADPALTFARRFYIAQWLRDCSKEIEAKTKKMSEERRNSNSRTSTPKKQRPKSRSKKPKKPKPRNSRRLEDDDEEEEDEEVDSEETEEEDYDEECEESKLARKTSNEMEWLKVAQMEIEKRKKFLFKEATSFRTFKSSIRQSKSRLDYDSALLVARYLASNRPFSQSFDIYLTQILKVLNDTAVAVRSRALKCLAAVVEADPGVLARKDMQLAVHTRFIDSSTSVREAAIELVGKFILIRPELTAQYYDMLSERILDTGISVRKRVIKIFRDVCLEQPNFPKVPEMCVKMVRRVNDEEGIRKLVNETFQSMWFSPCRDKDSSSLLQKVLNITEVASIASTSIGFEWLERLMENLLKAEQDSKEKPVLKSCRQIVDCLVDNVLRLETNADAGATNSRLAACFSTLYLFCKVKPILLVKHCTMIHPYLNIKFMTKSDVLIASNVVKMLELAVPLMEHPGESFLAQLEEDISKLVLRQGAVVIQSGISCLGAIVRDITHNYKLILDCFNKFYGISSRIRERHFGFMGDNIKSCLRRSLFVVGQLCKQFDFDAPEFEEFREMSCVKEKVFELLLHFIEFPEIKVQALAALGCLTTRYFELMLGKELRDIYQKMLTDSSVESNMCCQVLNNIKEYLIEEEVKMAKADAEWRKLHDKENLKEMGDVQSGMASTIIQIYLKQILESFFHLDSQVRMAALEVVTLILNQGLVHPQQCMAQLICMGSDPNVNIRLKADKQIMEIDKKYPGFVQARAMQGIKMSCRLQKLLHQQQENQQSGQLRGVRAEENGTLTSLNSYIYSLVRSNRSNRRVVVMNALRMFEDKTPLEELLYMADNLAYFSYQLQDEPLFIIHQIDIILSVSGFNLLQSFKEGFYPPPVRPCPLENGTSSSVKQEEDDDKEGEVKHERLTPSDGVTVKEELKEEMKCEASSSATTTITSTENHHHNQTTKEQQRQTPVPRYDDDDDEEDDPETLLALIPVEGDSLVELYTSLQGYLLLLVLKQHLKEMYGFTDNKIQQYSPMDFKAYEKSVNRKHGLKFQPTQVLELLARAEPLCQRNAEHRREIVNAYLNFKELMASIDKEDMDDDASPTTTTTTNAQDGSVLNTTTNGPPHSTTKRSSAPSGKSRKAAAASGYGNNRQTTSSGRSSHHQPSSAKKNKKKPKRRKNVCSDSEDDDDDDCDDDDDDWQ